MANSMFAALPAFHGPEHEPFWLPGGHPAALLVHGFPGTPAEMRPLADALHRSGWSVQGLLLPGFGREMATLGERSATDWTAAVRTALAVLQQDHAPVLLIGYSMGGAVALDAAVAATAAPDAIVLLSPFWRLAGGGWTRWFWPLIRRFVPQFRPFRLFRPNFADPEVRKGIAQFLPGADLDDPAVRQAILDFNLPTRVIDQAMSAGRRGFTAAPGVKGPVLIVQGAQDELVRPERTLELAQRMGNVVALHTLPAGHDLMQPDRPAWADVVRLVVSFAESVRSPS